MAQEQLRQDPALNGCSWPIAEGCTRALSSCGEIFAPLAGMFNREKNFSLKVPTALQCWKKNLYGGVIPSGAFQSLLFRVADIFILEVGC